MGSEPSYTHPEKSRCAMPSQAIPPIPLIQQQQMGVKTEEPTSLHTQQSNIALEEATANHEPFHPIN
jgi:hypothetical protein